MSPKEMSSRLEELEGKFKDLQKTVAELQVIIVNVVSSHADYQDAIDLHKEYVRSQESACKDHIINEERIGDAINAIKDDNYGEPELGSHDLSDDQQALDSVYGEDDHGVERL